MQTFFSVEAVRIFAISIRKSKIFQTMAKAKKRKPVTKKKQPSAKHPKRNNFYS